MRENTTGADLFTIYVWLGVVVVFPAVSIAVIIHVYVPFGVIV